MACKLCGKDAEYVDAHIVPASFFRDLKATHGQDLKMISNDASAYPKRTPIGVYDECLVCGNCEQLFGPSDSYAADLLCNREAEFFQTLAFDGGIAYEAQQFDYARLRLFILSLLWRASESSHEYFHRIDLAPRIPRLKELLLNGSVGGDDEFSTIIARWTSAVRPSEFTTLQASPYEYRENTSNIRFIRIYLNRFVLDVQVDKSPSPRWLRDCRIQAGKPLLAPGRDLDSSRDLKALRPAIETYDRARRRTAR